MVFFGVSPATIMERLLRPAPIQNPRTGTNLVQFTPIVTALFVQDFFDWLKPYTVHLNIQREHLVHCDTPRYLGYHQGLQRGEENCVTGKNPKADFGRT